MTTPNTELRKRLVEEFGIDEYGVMSENGHYIVRRVSELITRAERQAELKGRVQVLREVVDNPGHKTYYNELLNDALKELRILQEDQANE